MTRPEVFIGLLLLIFVVKGTDTEPTFMNIEDLSSSNVIKDIMILKERHFAEKLKLILELCLNFKKSIGIFAGEITDFENTYKIEETTTPSSNLLAFIPATSSSILTGTISSSNSKGFASTSMGSTQSSSILASTSFSAPLTTSSGFTQLLTLSETLIEATTPSSNNATSSSTSTGSTSLTSTGSTSPPTSTGSTSSLTSTGSISSSTSTGSTSSLTSTGSTSSLPSTGSTSSLMSTGSTSSSTSTGTTSSLTSMGSTSSSSTSMGSTSTSVRSIQSSSISTSTSSSTLLATTSGSTPSLTSTKMSIDCGRQIYVDMKGINECHFRSGVGIQLPFSDTRNDIERYCGTFQTTAGKPKICLPPNRMPPGDYVQALAKEKIVLPNFSNSNDIYIGCECGTKLTDKPCKIGETNCNGDESRQCQLFKVQTCKQISCTTPAVCPPVGTQAKTGVFIRFDSSDPSKAQYFRAPVSQKKMFFCCYEPK